MNKWARIAAMMIKHKVKKHGNTDRKANNRRS